MISRSKRIHWSKQVRVPAAEPAGVANACGAAPSPRERLLAVLAERPQTVSQLAHALGVSPPTALEHVRRALRDGLIAEVLVPQDEKRFPAERYYAPAVPVIRQPDYELLESACRGLVGDMADALRRNQGDLLSAFAMTHLAREGWEFRDVWPYLQESIGRLVIERVGSLVGPVPVKPHGVMWIEDGNGPDADDVRQEEVA